MNIPYFYFYISRKTTMNPLNHEQFYTAWQAAQPVLETTDEDEDDDGYTTPPATIQVHFHRLRSPPRPLYPPTLRRSARLQLRTVPEEEPIGIPQRDDNTQFSFEDSVAPNTAPSDNEAGFSTDVEDTSTQFEDEDPEEDTTEDDDEGQEEDLESAIPLPQDFVDELIDILANAIVNMAASQEIMGLAAPQAIRTLQADVRRERMFHVLVDLRRVRRDLIRIARHIRRQNFGTRTLGAARADQFGRQ